MPQLSVDEANTDLAKLLDRAVAGDEVLIERNGVPVARLSALRRPNGDRILGLGSGTVKILSEDWADPMTEEEFWRGL